MARTFGRCGGSGIGPVNGPEAGRALEELPAAVCSRCPPTAWDGSGQGEFDELPGEFAAVWSVG
jgi:hypothetical protein